MMTTEEAYPSFEAELAAIDFSDLEAKYAVELDEDYGNILIIDNLPVVDAAKEEKLLAVLKKKFFGPANASLVEAGVFMPKDEQGNGKGYAFFQFTNKEQAEAAYAAVHGVRLDKSHQLYAIRFSDFDRLAALPDEWQAPELEAYKEREYLRDWLSDAQARDQFATLSAGNAVQVVWGPRAGGSIEVVEERKPWTDAYIQWSPKGSYLATVHGPGVMLWGGKSWARLGRFSHENVKLIGFSPDETFLVTFSLHDATRPLEPNLLVWDVQSGVLVRGLALEGVLSNPEGAPVQPLVRWPAMQFSSDDRYAALAHADYLSLYDCSGSFALLDKSEISGIREVSWSPAAGDHRLVYWVPETANTPARVALIEVPSRLVLRTKNLFLVDDCRFFWHPDGDYLAVQVDRFTTKSKKAVATNLEIFRIKEKNIPVEVLEFKERLLTVAWEPKGERLLTAVPAEFRSIVSFWSMKGDGKTADTARLLHTVERKQVDRFFWSPHGNHLVMADLGSANAFLEFWNVNEMVLLATKEHFLATDVQWDPSGRYVVSFVSAWKHTSDNGYCVWDLKGDLIHKQLLPRFATLLWRPRPASLLSAEKQKEIKKNYKTYAAAFEAADLRASNLESSDSAAVRLMDIRAWNEFRRRCLERFAANAAKRAALEPAPVQDGPVVAAENWVEDTVIEETEEVIQD